MKQQLQRLFSRRERDNGGLRAELELLREENLRLRLEQQRALEASRGAARIEELRSALERADASDDMWHALAQTTSLRESLLAACTELRLTIAAVERDLSGSRPPQELDRRVMDRRADDDVLSTAATNGDGRSEALDTAAR